MINLNNVFAKTMAHWVAQVKSNNPEDAPGFIECIEHIVEHVPPGNPFADELREIIKSGE